MPSDIEVQDASTVMDDDKEAIEHADRDRRDGEEIHGSNGFPVVAQKAQPPLAWFGISGCPAHPPGNRSFGDIGTEHQKLAVNAWCAPGRVLDHHTEDEIPHLNGNPLLPITRRALGITRQ